MLFGLGVISGILLSILAVLAGKKISVEISQEPIKPVLDEQGKPKLAQIIKRNYDPVEEALHG